MDVSRWSSSYLVSAVSLVAGAGAVCWGGLVYNIGSAMWAVARVCHENFPARATVLGATLDCRNSTSPELRIVAGLALIVLGIGISIAPVAQNIKHTAPQPLPRAQRKKTRIRQCSSVSPGLLLAGCCAIVHFLFMERVHQAIFKAKGCGSKCHLLSGQSDDPSRAAILSAALSVILFVGTVYYKYRNKPPVSFVELNFSKDPPEMRKELERYYQQMKETESEEEAEGYTIMYRRRWIREGGCI